jgi:hypothetical protein
MRGALLRTICAAAVALGLSAPSAGAAFDDPLFFYTPQGSPGALGGPCGLALGATGNLYVADYYHRAVNTYTTPLSPSSLVARPLFAPGTSNPHSGPLDDPCALAFNTAGALYLNNYHRNVIRFPAPLSLATATVLDAGDPTDIFANPTGVATDPATNNVYVNDRTYIAAYNSSGAPLAAPKIGVGTLGDGYGIAVSGFPATAGRIYVPDAATETVKVYDPAIDLVNPVQTITGPPGGFKSLQDAAIAVDNTSGEIYVTDTLGPQLTEKPQATVYVFDSTGAYEGRLKHNTIDAAPSGLAVDNNTNLGRVYVTSGITENASIYVYPPDAATSASLPPFGASASAAPSVSGGSAGAARAASVPPDPSAATATSSAVSQEGNLRVAVSGKLSPRRLPRKGVAPISVAVGGQVSTTDGAPPPELKTIAVEINRNGHFDTTGLPLCPLAKIQPASSARALANCRSALVGEGAFTALAGFGEAESGAVETYETQGRLLLFNGKQGKKPVLFGQIYSARPFATSFVIPFTVKDISKGSFGTILSATLPAALRSWGNLTGIEMKLSRRYAYEGKSHSYLSAGCPAPKGFGVASFPLVRSTFAFEGGVSVSSTLTDQCKVRG